LPQDALNFFVMWASWAPTASSSSSLKATKPTAVEPTSAVESLIKSVETTPTRVRPLVPTRVAATFRYLFQGLRSLFELGFRIRIPLIAIRVILERFLAVCLLNLNKFQ